MVELQNYINSYFGVPKDNIEKVVELFSESTLCKGDYFAKSGQYCEKLSFVQSGYIRVYANVEDKEVTQWIATKGHFLTDLHSFMFQQRGRWNMQALTDCQLYTIHKEEYALLNATVLNWPELEKRFISACFITLEDRVFSHLSLSAKERYEQFFKNNQELFNQVPLQYLASMLGMSPETLSRIRSNSIS